MASLYDASSAFIYGVAMRMLSDAADAEEVALDVYKYVWANASSYDPSRGRVLAWLVMLTRSRCLDRLRSRQARQFAEQPLSPHSGVAWPDPIGARRADRVEDALRRLPPEQAEVLRLAYFMGLSQSELVERTGLPLGTIKTRLRLGLAKLRDLLHDWRPY
jgi:RNA polymerase sigma factor (sigma-70 family)